MSGVLLPTDSGLPIIVSSHLLFSGLCMAGVAWAGLVLLNPATVAVAASGSLMPDLDHSRSWFGRRLPFISYPIPAIFGHRGITHSLLCIAGMAYVLSGKVIISDLLNALLIGYRSHIFGGSFMHKGIPLLWP